jgi:hypothetical protein
MGTKVTEYVAGMFMAVFLMYTSSLALILFANVEQ